MQTMKMTVTPEMASNWLSANNNANRSLSALRVENIANDILNGKWHLTHQGIAFYEDGDIADGQHRLSALVKCNTPIEILVTFGLPKPAGIGIDITRPRSAVDGIRIAGESDWITKEAVAITKIIAAINGKSNISTHQILAICNRLEDEIKTSLDLFKTHRRCISTAAVKCAFLSAIGHVSSEQLKLCADSLYSGIPTSPNEFPMLRLRERLLTDSLTGSVARSERVRLIQRAIKACGDGENIKSLKLPKEFIYPIPDIKDIL